MRWLTRRLIEQLKLSQQGLCLYHLQTNTFVPTNTKARLSQEVGQRTPGIAIDERGPPRRLKGPTGNLPDAKPDENGPVFFLFDFEAPSKQRGTKDTNVAPDV